MHNCSKILKARPPSSSSPYYSSNPNYFSTDFRREGRPKISFSKNELKHIAIASVLVFAIGAISYFSFGPAYLSIAGGVLVIYFLLHELGHKIVAQRNNMGAEFRTTPMGIFWTVLTLLLPFKIFAAGAVFISGSGDQNAVGRSVIVGPIINILLAVGAFAALSFVADPLLSFLFYVVAQFNALLAFFNLIPIAILDGKKIFDWSKTKWGVAFGISLILELYFVLRIFGL
jgi:Zn-dependent protease